MVLSIYKQRKIIEPNRIKLTEYQRNQLDEKGLGKWRVLLHRRLSLGPEVPVRLEARGRVKEVAVELILKSLVFIEHLPHARTHFIYSTKAFLNCCH